MANPIIKIKRGIGQPSSWDAVVGNTYGITAGEFAFNRQTNVLFIGVTGGYCGFNGSPLSATTSNTIAVGMQISNDVQFGGANPTVDALLGYSNYTTPTTKAVRDFVNTKFAESALGVTFREGPGIGLTFAVSGTDVDVTITNEGALKSFSSLKIDPVNGGKVSGDGVIDSNAPDAVLNLGSGSGIKIIASDSSNSISIYNDGVTGIGGVTGGISNINPIKALNGFTTAVGVAMIDNFSSDSPIKHVYDLSRGLITVGHNTSGVLSGRYGGANSIVSLDVDITGHITRISEDAIVVGGGMIPAGLTEFVQDTVSAQLRTGMGNGIGFTYDDNTESGTLRSYITGIRDLGVFPQPNGANVGLCGEVRLEAGANISLAQSKVNNRITITGTAPNFSTIQALPGTDIAAGGIYAGGTLGKGVNNNTIQADAASDTLKLYAGKGIGISAGQTPLADDQIVLWNTGVHQIKFYDGANQEIKSGFSGDVQIYASSGVNFVEQNNGIKISATGVGSVGASSLIAQYGITEANNPLNVWNGNGVTGNINFYGRNGLITRQTTGNDAGVDGTNNGNMYIDLSSIVRIPPNVFEGSSDTRSRLDIASYLDGSPNNVFKINNSSTAVVGVDPVPPVFNNNNLSMPETYNYLETDMIISGLTGNVSYQTGNPAAAGYATISDFDANSTIIPGKMLILLAPNGNYKKSSGGNLPTVSNKHAEIRMLAWPNAENLGSELMTTLEQPTTQCPNANCSGWNSSPSLPTTCIGGGVSPIDDTTDSKANRGSVRVVGNLLLNDSVLVKKDIWLAGNIYDASTACLKTLGGSTQTCLECKGLGNVGITGSVTVMDNMYVHGASAFFNLDNLSTSSPVISFGGLSGDTVLDGNPTATIAQNSDRGFKIYNSAVIPASPVGAASSRLNRVSYVGLKTDEGVFTYIPDATQSVSGQKYTWGGLPGAAFFSMINGVGLTSEGDKVELRVKKNAVHYASIKSTGHIQFVQNLFNTANESQAFTFNTVNSGSLSVNTSQPIIFTSNIESPVVFNKGLTFDVGPGFYTTTSNDFNNSGDELTKAVTSHSLKLKWKNNSGTGSPNHVNIRNLGENSHTQVVDVGRFYLGNEPSSSTNLNVTPGTGTSVYNSPQQTLWNKNFGDGTFIDCGTY